MPGRAAPRPRPVRAADGGRWARGGLPLRQLPGPHVELNKGQGSGAQRVSLPLCLFPHAPRHPLTRPAAARLRHKAGRSWLRPTAAGASCLTHFLMGLRALDLPEPVVLIQASPIAQRQAAPDAPSSRVSVLAELAFHVQTGSSRMYQTRGPLLSWDIASSGSAGHAGAGWRPLPVHRRLAFIPQAAVDCGSLGLLRGLSAMGSTLSTPAQLGEGARGGVMMLPQHPSAGTLGLTGLTSSCSLPTVGSLELCQGGRRSGSCFRTRGSRRAGKGVQAV